MAPGKRFKADMNAAISNSCASAFSEDAPAKVRSLRR